MNNRICTIHFKELKDLRRITERDFHKTFRKRKFVYLAQYRPDLLITCLTKFYYHFNLYWKLSHAF